MATYKKINQLEEAAKRLNTAGAELGNMTYDNFKTGNAYKGLQRDYQQGGQMAMKDTLGQVAARTGGMASSYATSAANQSYNNYMQGLEDAARSLFNDEYSRAKDKYNTARDEYSTAYGEYRDAVGDERYKTEWDYKVGRDELEDQRYEDTQTKERVATQRTDLYNLVASGGTPNKNDYPDLSDAEYNNIVATASGKRTDANRKTVDSEFETMFGAEGFDWNNYDWNGDGKVDESDSASAYDFSGSSYGADYWEQYWKDSQQGYADADIEAAQDEVIEILEAGGEPPIDLLIKAGWLEEITPVNEGETPDYDSDGNGIPDGLSGLAATMWQNNIDAENEAAALENEAKAEEDKIAAVNDIEARIANGESLDAIAEAYGITNDAGWKTVTGMSLAEWTKKVNDNKTSKYHFADTSEGRTGIVDKMLGSGNRKLNAGDQDNFDYLYGDGAYDAVQTFISRITPDGSGKDSVANSKNFYNYTRSAFEGIYNDLVDTLMTAVPALDYTQVLDMVEKANPEMYKAATNLDTYFKE